MSSIELPKPAKMSVKERLLTYLVGTLIVGGIILGGWLLNKNHPKAADDQPAPSKAVPKP